VLEAEAILERIDRVIAELQAIKASIAASLPAPTTSGNGLDPDPDNDFRPECLIDAASS
jgi:hypothetical protein